MEALIGQRTALIGQQTIRRLPNIDRDTAALSQQKMCCDTRR
jgi:hypothetical protein